MIRFYRSCLMVLCFTIFGIGAGIISFIIFPYISLTIKKENRKKAYANTIRSSWNGFKNFFQKIGLVKVCCKNPEKLENLSGKVIVANHPTLIDVIILISLIPNSVCIAKKETLKNPLFRNIVQSIYITNDTDLETYKTEADKFLKKGFNIVIFPSGTRTKPDENFKIHNGSAVIAINSNTEIIPVKITTDYPFLQKHQPIYDIGEHQVNFYIDVKNPINPANFQDISEIKMRKHINNKIKEEII